MAKSEFLQNFKTARNLFFHKVRTDHKSVDPNAIESQLHRGAIWLAPSAVKGFDVRDFSELPVGERQQLSDSVRRFRDIAAEVPATNTPTRAQLEAAYDAFLTIVRIVDSYFAGGDEERRVREVLETAVLPEEVLTWELELAEDSTGDASVWIWIFVNDETAEREDFPALANEVQATIRKALSAAGIQRWPYVRFRTAAEQRAL